MRKLLIFFVILFPSFIFGQTLIFSDIEDLPEKKSAIAYANNDTDIYVVNGFTNTLNFSSTIHKYNTESNSWSLISDLSIKKRFASAEIIGDKLYIFNGLTPLGLNDTVEVVDLNTLEIRSLVSSNPNPAKGGGSAVWNGEFYSFGGSVGPGNYSDKLSKYNPISKKWTDVSTMPIAAEVKGEIVDGKLYVIGGYNGTVSKKVFIYDIANDQWESEVDVPMGLSAMATTTQGSKIWIVGDYANLNFIGYFDTEDNSFMEVTNNMNPRRHCGTASINGSLFVIGGNTESSIETAMSSVQKADIITQAIQLDFSASIMVFPNPTQDILKFDTEIENISIFSSAGILIKKMDGAFYQINIKDIASGNYFITGYVQNKLVRVSWIKI